MKRIVIGMLALVMGTAYAHAQGAGLSQGEAVKAPSYTPQTKRKKCPQCGITMGNVTYPWQHESWCPHYRERGGGGDSAPRMSSGSSVSTSNAGIVAGGIASGLGSYLSGALSNWLNSEPKRDYSVYKNTQPGTFLNWGSDYDYEPNKEQKYVVVRAGNKVGVWENSWVTRDKKTRYPGEWLIKPTKYDYIWMSHSGLKEYPSFFVSVVGVKQKEGDASSGMFYGFTLHEFTKLNKYTDFRTRLAKSKEIPLVVAFGYTDEQGRKLWDLWSVALEKKKKSVGQKAVQLGGPYEDVTVWDEYVRVTNGGRHKLLDHYGREIYNRDFARIGTPTGPAKVVWAQNEAGGKYGVIDSLGRTVLPFENEEISLCDGGTVIYGNGGLYGALLPNGERVPMEYKKISETFWTRDNGQNVITLFVEKDGVNYYISHGKLIPVIAPVNLEAKHSPDDSTSYYNTLVKYGCSFSSWYDKKTAKLKEEFMQRGEFEREADYKARIADSANLGKYLSSKISAPVDEYLKSFPIKNLARLGKYDMDNECFPVSLDQAPWEVVRIPVPLDVAPEFKKKASVEYNSTEQELRNDFPAIKSVKIKVDRKYPYPDSYFTVKASLE
jgi:hypothetical protein